MSMPSKVINVRLSPEQAERFRRLKAEFAGLPQATVLRLLIDAFMELPLERQIEALTRQIRQPAKDRTQIQNERIGMNANRGKPTTP